MAKTTITKILMRRGSDFDRSPTVLDEGEPGWTTDTCRLYVGDGRRTGGVPIVNIRTPQNAPVHEFNNDLIYSPIQDITGTSQPPTQEVLAINHPGLSASITREWMDDRYILRDPCATNSRNNPPDPIICAPNSGLLPKQIIKAHVDIEGDLVVYGHSTFKNGIKVSGEADFCDAVIKAKQIISCDANITSKIDIGDDIDIVTKGFTLSASEEFTLDATDDVTINTDGNATISTGGDVTITGKRTEVIGDSLTVPFGTTNSRPDPPKLADFRWNTDFNRMENFDGNVWSSVGGESKTYYIEDEDVKETTSSAVGARQIYLTTGMTNLNVPASDLTANKPVFIVKVVHNLNQLYPTLIVYDDYRKQVIPDEIWMLDENTCLVNITSYLDPDGPPQWGLSTTGPGHQVFTPPMHYSLDGIVQTSAPDILKKWVITIQG